MAKSANNIAKDAMMPREGEGRLAVSLLYTNRDHLMKFRKVPLHKHPSWQADMILEGCALFVDASGRETALNPGETILIAPGLRHSFIYRKPGVKWLTFWFSAKGLSGKISSLRIEASPLSRSFFSTFDLLLEGELPQESRAAAIGSALAAFLEASFPDDGPRRPVLPGLLGQAMLWIERSEGRRVDIKEICEAIGCSPSHLSHSFRRQFGQPLKEFIDARRAEVVDRLVRQAELSPAQLAESLGFRDSCELSRFCRRRLGLSPRKLGL